jgi:hypothetical protein
MTAAVVGMAGEAGAADDYREAVMEMTDGKVLEGWAVVPGWFDSRVLFRASEDAKALRYDARKVRALVFFEGDEEVEMVYAQCDFAVSFTSMKIEYGWVIALKHGAAMLYYQDGAYTDDYLRRKNNVLTMAIFSSNFVRKENGVDFTYFVHREGEKYFRAIPREGFAGVMSKYFKDYPELAARIKQGEEGYTGVDFEAIIEEYNAWRGR